MSIWEIILVGVGLSMDAAAVSISNTLCLRKIKARDVLMMCIAFGVFQCLMPIIGYFGASLFKDYIMVYDHWIALLLLLFIGGKMVYETLRHSDEADACEVNFRLTFKLVAVQAIATSIDALAVGISFSALNVNIFVAASLIMATTFLICLVAIGIAHKVGQRLANKAELIGGFILIAIGLKIFIEHMVTGS
ncbi:MAG: manganese efflux pump MntP family protein [Oscillospiraceae bacterium]|jgi:putative Mn2+ efflux pump MntP